MTDGDYAYFARRLQWGRADTGMCVGDEGRARRAWRLTWADRDLARSLLEWLEGPIGDDPWPLVLRTVDTHLCGAVRETVTGPSDLRTGAWEAADRAVSTREVQCDNPSAPGTAYPRLNLDITWMLWRHV